MKKKSSNRGTSKAERKERQREATEKANRIHQVISTANAEQDLLAPLAAFCSMDVEIAPPTITTAATTTPAEEEEEGEGLAAEDGRRNDDASIARKKATTTTGGTDTETTKLKIEFYTSPLPPKLRSACLDLFQKNMGSLYRSSAWGLNLGEKDKEFRHDGARFLVVRRQDGTEDNSDGTEEGGACTDPIDDGGTSSIVAFTHFRFESNDEDIPPADQEAVLYVYECQVSDRARRGGLGRRLMSIMELIAMKRVDVGKVMLTVFKANRIAMEFYLDKMRYGIDESSPSLFEREEGEDEVDYEILSKCTAKKC